MAKKGQRKRQVKSYDVEVVSSLETSAETEKAPEEIVETIIEEVESLAPVEEPEEQEIIKEVPKERYFECPFCGLEGRELSGRDPINTWCTRCGKCFIAHWVER